MSENASVLPELPPLTINPCIFVGIGTTGMAILEQLRRLFYEEFGVAGLACFRYLSFETDKENRPKDNFLPSTPKQHERIEFIPLNVPDLDEVSRRRSPELDTWLDPRTLKFNQRGYQSGAGQRRQAGRLCLWENWASVRTAISKAVESVATQENRMSADAFLRENYFPRKRPLARVPEGCLVTAVPRVYLFGTLCGGTCSGIFLDLAYFFHTLLHVRHFTNLMEAGTSEIIGLFTIPDTIYMQDKKSLPHVVGAWAALSELDYYSKDETSYEFRMPDQPQKPTREPPFTTAYLVSKRNTGRTGFTSNDADGLHQMCAMNLFTEVVAGMAAAKAANRVNLPSAGAGFLGVNAAGHVRAFSTFGLSAIWYPRYRIAKAICRRLGEEMCSDWLGINNFQPTRIEEVMRADWIALLNWAKGSLLGTVQDAHCPAHLPDELGKLFERREPEFKAASREGLENCILNFPGGDTTVGQRLAAGGEYYRQVESAAPLLAPELRRRLRDVVITHLRTRTFAELRHYLASLEAEVKTTAERIPAELAPYTQSQDLSRAHEVYEDRATWSLGRRRSAIQEFKQQIWDQFRQRTLGYLDHLRDHFLQQVLANVQDYVGTLRREVENAAGKLTVFRGTCSREREELVKVPHSTNIVILSDGKPDEIADDVDQGVAAIRQSTAPEQLRTAFLSQDDAAGQASAIEHDPLELLESRHEILMNCVEKRYEGLAQAQAARFQIGREALRTASAHMQNLVYSSAPYFEPSPEWRPMTTPQTPNFLFCGGQDIAGQLVDEANRHLLGTSYAYKPSTLDHFIFFYQETPGLALSDFAIAQFAAERLAEIESNPESTEPTRYSHKLGRRMFDTQAILDTARQWVRDTQALVEDLFQKVDGKPCLAYTGADGLGAEVYVEDGASLRQFIRERGLDGLLRLLADGMAKVGKPELLKRMDERRLKAQKREEREALAQRHHEILKTVFPSQP